MTLTEKPFSKIKTRSTQRDLTPLAHSSTLLERRNCSNYGTPSGSDIHENVQSNNNAMMLPIPMRFMGNTTREFPQVKTPSAWVVNPTSGRLTHSGAVMETDDDGEYSIAVRFNSRTVHCYIPPSYLWASIVS